VDADETRRSAESPNPLYTLAVEDGAGALLGGAAGDVAGGAHPTGYSAVTQTSTVLAYHLLQHRVVLPGLLAEELWALGGGDGRVPVYRGISTEFSGWLDAFADGHPRPSTSAGSEAASRMAPLGLWYRRDPDGLVGAVVSAVSVTHIGTTAVAAAGAVAGAVAAASHGQAGLDLVTGAAETADAVMAEVDLRAELPTNDDGGRAFGERLRAAAPLVSRAPGEILARIAPDGPVGADRALLAVVLGGAVGDPIRGIEAGAMSGGSETGAMVGAITGARSGLVRWPWRVPNDTWFAEIGRRLVAHHDEVRDLPVPYAVEERATLMVPHDASEESL
jgi:ADP-ribosylglycohydrolase